MENHKSQFITLTQITKRKYTIVMEIYLAGLRQKVRDSMERLTESNPSWIDDELWERACEPDCEEIDAVYRKLKDYEDAEEQGLLLRLPCKVGDTLYRVNKGAKEPVIMMRVIQLYIKQIHKDRTVMRIDAINDADMGESCYLPCDIGERIFLTREEAEAKLKEMEENQ